MNRSGPGQVITIAAASTNRRPDGGVNGLIRRAKRAQFSHVDAARRPFQLDGTWERYSFRAGNLLFLMMSDINEPTQKVGRGTLGGNSGVVSGETFRWWKRMVEQNPTLVIVSARHYMLKNTTVASGEWEGMRRDEKGGWKSWYHGYWPQGTPQGASFLYWVDSKPDSAAFENVLAAAPGRVDLSLGAHTHTSPDDTYGGKSHIATAAMDVVTFHNDNARTGQDLHETLLTLKTVHLPTFGKVNFLTMDGTVDAQPLYLSSVKISGQGMHNVLYVALEHASVNAFDETTPILVECFPVGNGRELERSPELR